MERVILFIKEKKVKKYQVTTDEDYTVQNLDYFIEIDASSNNVTITLLPAGTQGRELEIRCKNCNYTAKVVPDGSDVIDLWGSEETELEYINNGDVINLFDNGTKWIVK